MRGLALLAVLGITMGAARIARAQDVSVRLDYSGPEGCPSAAAFQREVETRLDRGRIAGSVDLARTYRVTAEPTAGGLRVTLEFTDHDGSHATREVTSASCDEAVNAMALITALAIEARVAREGVAAQPLPKEPPSVPPPPPPESPPPPPGARAEPATVFGFGASVGIERSFSPKIAPAVAAVGELLHRQHAARVSLFYSDTGPATIDAGSAEFALVALRLSGCPWRLAASEGFALVPCAGLEGGFVRAAGKESDRIVRPKSAREPWFAAHALGRMELSPDPGLSFGVEGAMGFPLTRHEFVFERPEVVVHEVPAVSWSASAGMVARFR
jgi:hypothetical protein